MKILVFSDSHQDVKAVSRLLSRVDEYDKVVFCGDGIEHVWEYRDLYLKKFEMVRGNCDDYLAPEEITFFAGGIKFFVAHGHRYGVRSRLDMLSSTALVSLFDGCPQDTQNKEDPLQGNEGQPPNATVHPPNDKHTSHPQPTCTPLAPQEDEHLNRNY